MTNFSEHEENWRTVTAVSEKWRWRCRFYYADDVMWPKVPGSLAIETVHTSVTSRDIEVRAGEQRSDIGRIDVEPYYRYR